MLPVVVALALSQVPRTFHTLSSSNGHGAVMGDARSGRVVHFREHLPATEEPLLDAQGMEVWRAGQPQHVNTRDLLFDAYFGVRANGRQEWLSRQATTSGYLTAAPSTSGGSGVVTWRHDVLGLEATTFVFAPRSLPRAAFVMALRLKNTSAVSVPGVSAFSLHNFHLGFGRPGVNAELDANGETVVIHPQRLIEERAFAGVVVSVPVGQPSSATAWNSATPLPNGFQVVSTTTGDLSDRSGDLGVGTDWVSALQFDHGTLAAGEERWAAVVFAHSGDPFARAEVQQAIESYVQSRTAAQLVDAERTEWEAFQQRVRLPASLSADELIVARQSAVVLAMSQVRSTQTFLRDVLSRDQEPRFTRFRTLDGGTTLPGTITHRGFGAVLASLPPGEWTYSWIRDGAYSAAALATLGLTTESRDALRFYLDAEGGRFRDWDELKPYAFPPYVISLTRYTGFGVEETDFNDFGPNLEFDGFGLFLWALATHERQTQDTTLTDSRWNEITTRIADPLVALVDPATGLIRRDSSIWETHWKGRERSWAYTSITAARGLCDAAAMAERRADSAHATKYRTAGRALRDAIASRLTRPNGAISSNLEEHLVGDANDAAVFDAMAMGLFDAKGFIGRGTTEALQSLRVASGPGWSRNDDRTDHSGRTDLSPWGSEYDSAEWVITDLRGSMVLREQNDRRADTVLGWITSNAVSNAGLIPETFDERTGAWKFNAPMAGFGAGAYVLALQHRVTPVTAACGDWSTLDVAPVTPVPDAGVVMTPDPTLPARPKPCGCSSLEGASLLALLVLRRRSAS